MNVLDGLSLDDKIRLQAEYADLFGKQPVINNGVDALDDALQAVANKSKYNDFINYASNSSGTKQGLMSKVPWQYAAPAAGFVGLELLRQDKPLLERGISAIGTGIGTYFGGPIGAAAGYGAAELINALIPNPKEQELLQGAMNYQMMEPMGYM